MWNILGASMDVARFYIDRQDSLQKFCACQPVENKPWTADFTVHSNCHISLDHTYNAITYYNFSKQILTSLPSQYMMILMVLNHRWPLPAPEDAMHDLRQGEITPSHIKELEDTSAVAGLHSQIGTYHGWCKGSGCGERSSGTRDIYNSKYTKYKSDSHTTNACSKLTCTQEGGKIGNDKCTCFLLSLIGNANVNCIS